MAKYIDADKLKAEIERRRVFFEYKGETPDEKAWRCLGELIQFLDTLSEESEQPTMGYDEDYLNEKIAKATKSWKGVDVDKFMDEVRDREPDKDLNEAIREYDTQKYTPSQSVSIEDVARVQFASHAKVFDKKRKAVFDWEQFKEVAGIFYGFGKKDSPETKEKEQPDKDLEEEVKNYFQGYWPGTETAEQCNTDLHFTPLAILRLARHFAGWQYQKDRGEFAKIKAKTWCEGFDACKEQMMKDAVEGEIQMRYSGSLCAKTIRVINEDKFKLGDKVSIIVLPKEDEK